MELQDAGFDESVQCVTLATPLVPELDGQSHVLFYTIIFMMGCFHLSVR